MARYLALVTTWMKKIKEWKISWVSKNENGQANTFARISTAISIRETTLLPICYQVIPLIWHERVNDINQANLGEMATFVRYLQMDEVDANEAHKIWMQVARYSLINGQLYRWSFRGPYLRCLNKQKTRYVLAKLHEEVCGNHTEGRIVTHWAHSQGYYWPTMKTDDENYVKICDCC